MESAASAHSGLPSLHMSFPGFRSWDTTGLALTADPTFEVRFTPTRTRAAARITNTRRIRRLQRGVAAETSPGGAGNARRHDRTFATATEWCTPPRAAITCG